jgi:hypothetical protein
VWGGTHGGARMVAARRARPWQAPNQLI